MTLQLLGHYLRARYTTEVGLWIGYHRRGFKAEVGYRTLHYNNWDTLRVKTSLLSVARRGVLAVAGAMAPAPTEARVYMLGPCPVSVGWRYGASLQRKIREDMELILNAGR